MSHMGLAILQRLSLNESHELHESHRNKDVPNVRRRVRLVKCGTPFTIIRNMDALDLCGA